MRSDTYRMSRQAEKADSVAHSNGHSRPIAHNGGLGSSYIIMSDEEARALARGQFAIDGYVTRLATEKDDTFRVDATDGRRYTLKIANPAEAAEELSFETCLLRHIAAADPTIPVPRIVPDVIGRVLGEFLDRAGQHRHVRMMTYMDGIPLDTTTSTPRERERVGEMLARLRLATSNFSHPAESRTLAWDVKHLLSLRNLLGDIDDLHKRCQLESGMERFSAVAGRLAGLRSQVLHNDFSKSNIIVDHAHTEFVTGIIDFGDAVRTAIAIDVSTALVNQLRRSVPEHPSDDLFEEGRDLLRGYLRVAELADAEIAIMPHLVMGRVIARALITLWRARLFPGNSTYILRNTEQGWGQLDWFLQRSADDVSYAFRGTSVTGQ